MIVIILKLLVLSLIKLLKDKNSLVASGANSLVLKEIILAGKQKQRDQIKWQRDMLTQAQVAAIPVEFGRDRIERLRLPHVSKGLQTPALEAFQKRFNKDKGPMVRFQAISIVLVSRMAEPFGDLDAFRISTGIRELITRTARRFSVGHLRNRPTREPCTVLHIYTP